LQLRNHSIFKNFCDASPNAIKNPADAPLLLESFSKRPRTWSEASRFSVFQFISSYKQNKTNTLPSFIDRYFVNQHNLNNQCFSWKCFTNWKLVKFLNKNILLKILFPIIKILRFFFFDKMASHFDYLFSFEVICLHFSTSWKDIF
jgi:hypothetical protein